MSVSVAEGLRKIRRRRVLMFSLFIGFAPAATLVALLTSDNVGLLVAGIVGIAYVISGQIVIYSHCPRCGEYFHQGPFPWPYERRFLGLINPDVMRRTRVIHPGTRQCLNCGVRLKERRD
jgi:hypothetical protein